MNTSERANVLDQTVAGLVKTGLAPLVTAIDREGLYPAEFLRALGAAGGFGAAIPAAYGGAGLGIGEQIGVTAQVGRECGSTAFLVWCQSACAQYLLASPNSAVRERYLAPVTRGERFAGTGMSNPVKHLSGIERIHLAARREGQGYRVSGSLPWVSNIGPDHLAIVAAGVEDGGYVMFALHGNGDGVSLHACPEFAGMEGTQTLNIRLKEAYIGDDDVLAHPAQFDAYLAAIKPGFVLGQAGMAIGIIEGSLKTIRESNVITAHVNVFLDDQGDALASELAQLRGQAQALALQAGQGNARILDVLKLRAAASELTLRAANSAILHAGAKGYLMRHPAQRRLREAVFVAIVTPALKHLRKEIHRIEAGLSASQAA